VGSEDVYKRQFFLGASAAAALLAVLVALLYRSAERLMGLLGPAGVRVTSRLVAFILLCIGTQITLDGLEAVFHPGAD